ncbi:MAG: ABC transporter related protein [Candidatus Woesebacteria bacterium GW2011_GWB1_40_101]|uniref:ABC transporter related protein n=1 Tax=Candidatus Woesebacteria bacterium GW2011_GWB1_40_101 TaxID=1618575 RepID=A0A0G0QRB1_9BACT|nr:MAG: ABC transporter related protein [Candidatus Woesebacteria bacterium GW2011_GWB1_40_101]
MKDPLLRVTDLKVKFDHHVVLDDINFEVGKDETLAVIGPNGAGKTVLFRALLGLVPYEGKVEWAKGTKIGYVPQKLSIEKDLPLTTLEFFGLKEKSRKEIDDALASVGFEEDKPHKGHLSQHVLNRKIGVLSGGELQRVLIAFALLEHPDVLLFDEPTAGVDITAEETIYGLLRKLQERENLTIILISHELHVVYRYANNVICLNKEKICFGPPREVLDKESLEKLYGHEAGVYEHHHEHK